MTPWPIMPILARAVNRVTTIDHELLNRTQPRFATYPMN